MLVGLGEKCQGGRGCLGGIAWADAASWKEVDARVIDAGLAVSIQEL